MKSRFLFFLVSVSIVHLFAASEDSAPAYWQRAMEAAHRGATDSAMVYFNKAFGQGLPDDSLYYLWSEIYLYKGDLDTSLALNYAVKSKSGSGLALKVAEQRYAIFLALGWTSEARCILDSLHSRSSRSLHRLIPECNFNLSGGVYHENSAVDRHYPYPRAGDSTSGLTNGNGAALLLLGWRLPLASLHQLRIGGKFGYGGSRFSVPTNAINGTDSADLAVGAFLRYSAFSGTLSAGYGYNVKRDFLHNTTSVHEFNLSKVMVTPTWLGSIDMSLQLEYPLRRNYYYFMAYADRELDSRNTMGMSLVVSGLAEEKLQLQDKVDFIYVEYSTIFSDSTYATPIRNRFDLASSPIHSVVWEYSMPMSYWSMNPQLHFERRMTKKMTLGINLTYSLSWYLEKYEWYDLRYQPGMEPQINGVRINGDSLIARNGNDGQFYWVRSISSVNNNQPNALLDTLPVAFHSERRIDQAFALGFSIRTSLGRFGDVIVDAAARRNFSTLMNSAPVDIQQWYGNVIVTWLFRFKPSDD